MQQIQSEQCKATEINLDNDDYKKDKKESSDYDSVSIQTIFFGTK